MKLGAELKLGKGSFTLFEKDGWHTGLTAAKHLRLGAWHESERT